MDSRERRQRIEALAHQIWEAEGRPDDQQQRHWHMAERLVEAEIAAARDEEEPMASRKWTQTSRVREGRPFPLGATWTGWV